MAGLDELAQLEAERDWLMSMIAYHKRPDPISSETVRKWADVVATGVLLGFGILFAAGLFRVLLVVLLAVQLDVGLLILLGVTLLAYLLTRRVTLFGAKHHVGEAVFALIGMGPTEVPGEPHTLQRLAECEARIAKLRAGRA
jgi:hypothetical protein